MSADDLCRKLEELRRRLMEETLHSIAETAGSTGASAGANLNQEALSKLTIGPAGPKPPKIYVHDFQEQWRFPRSKKRRIRNKWAKRKENWRAQKDVCYRDGTSGALICSPDFHRKLEQEINLQELPPS